MKKLILLTSIIFCLLVSSHSYGKAFNSCNEPGKPDFEYEVCPITVEQKKVKELAHKEKILINGNYFYANYTLAVINTIKKKGALVVEESKSIKVKKIDIDIKNHNCHHQRCKIEDYREYLQTLVGDVSLFFQGLKRNSNDRALLDNLLEKLVDGKYKATLADLYKGISYFFDSTSKKVFFRFLDKHGKVIAYIWADIDLDGNVVFQEYLYKKIVNDTDVSWIGRRDYDKNASNAMWNFLWERGLRRTKRCVDTIIIVTNEGGSTKDVDVTRCWYE